jgi:hypothetical protein
MRGHQQYVQPMQRTQQQLWQQQSQRQIRQRQQQERAAAYRAARRAQQDASAGFGVEPEGATYHESSGHTGRWLLVLIGTSIAMALLLGL